ncbi:family 43 glycosylhydrolase [Catenovulum agarivorans]|uniref:family 43 glycosylhydrolase n=1 Tax=Catenovulum agarivorans TaxID=1172192 RepID=UPI00037DB381|nr:family 43 glycosylhydrolase [Catenovulum agarivorans]
MSYFRYFSTLILSLSVNVIYATIFAMMMFAKQVYAQLPYGTVDVTDPNTQIPASVKPLFDTELRDTQITMGPDNYYYMTGTTIHDGGSFWGWNAGIHVWKSQDLKHWQPLGLVAELDKMNSWISDYYVYPKEGSEPGKVYKPNELPTDLDTLEKTHLVRRCAWANEIHYVPSQKTFFIVGSINHNKILPENTPYIGRGKPGGTFMLRSISGKAEGPYVDVQPEKPLTDGIDSSLFVDDDGKAYYVYQAHGIARIKDDFSGLAEEPRYTEFKAIDGVYHNEGAFLFKANGKYHYVTTSWSVKPEGSEFYTYDHSKSKRGKKLVDLHSYDPLLATSENVYGPYGEMRNVLSGGGHGNFFKDKDGQWWGTIFWNPLNTINPEGLSKRPALVAMKWQGEKLVVDKARTDEFYADMR